MSSSRGSSEPSRTSRCEGTLELFEQFGARSGEQPAVSNGVEVEEFATVTLARDAAALVEY